MTKKGKDEKTSAKIKPGKVTKSHGRQFRRDGMGFNEADKKQPEWKRFHELVAGTTLLEFVIDADMTDNVNAVAGHIRAGKYTVGTVEQRGEGWILQRPIECKRITDPDYVLPPPCVIRGGFKKLKVAIITGVKSG